MVLVSWTTSSYNQDLKADHIKALKAGSILKSKPVMVSLILASFPYLALCQQAMFEIWLQAGSGRVDDPKVEDSKDLCTLYI